MKLVKVLVDANKIIAVVLREGPLPGCPRELADSRLEWGRLCRMVFAGLWLGGVLG